MSKEARGAVHIANDVLADLAGYTALEGYGIVGMANPSLVDGVAQILPRQKLRKGVRIASGDAGVEVDLYVIVEHGINIAEVSHNLSERVRYALTDVADVAVCRIDIHVLDVRVRQER